MTFREQLALVEVPCASKDIDPNIFFGDSNDEDEKYNDEDAREAAKLCTPCPLKHLCLTDAITNLEYHGVRGGLTAPQRDRLRAQTAGRR